MATFQIPAPEPMNCKGQRVDLEANWKLFKDDFTDYEVATGLDKKDASVRVSALRRCDIYVTTVNICER